MSAAEVEVHLHEARVARRAGEPAGVLACLRSAWGLAASLGPEHPLVVRVAWKLAKAELDFGEVGRVVDHLTPVVAREDLFDAYPHGVFGLAKACRAHQDEVGYGHPTVSALWRRLAEHHRASGDRFRAALAELELAWDAACRGEPVGPLLDSVDHLQPEDLAGSPSWHPEATDAPSSLAWLHLEAAHTHLRAAIWCGDADEADPAAVELVHAVAELPVRPRAHIFHALLEAAHHGLLPHPDLPAVPEGSPFDRAFSEALLRGVGFREAAAAATGPEWRLAALWAGVPANEVGRDEVIAEARRSGCLAFVQAASRS
ncbi:MAG: hypothetical protein R3F61_18730 [Myxococcota bacterium]